MVFQKLVVHSQGAKSTEPPSTSTFYLDIFFLYNIISIVRTPVLIESSIFSLSINTPEGGGNPTIKSIYLSLYNGNTKSPSETIYINNNPTNISIALNNKEGNGNYTINGTNKGNTFSIETNSITTWPNPNSSIILLNYTPTINGIISAEIPYVTYQFIPTGNKTSTNSDGTYTIYNDSNNIQTKPCIG